MFQSIQTTIRQITRPLRVYATPGARGERKAVAHLKKHGYRILARNLRLRFGEVDVLAQTPDQKTLVVVEVKSSVIHHAQSPNTPRHYLPEHRVGRKKQHKLINLASYIVKRLNITGKPIRFDVIGVDLLPGKSPVIRHHVGAFHARV